MKRELGDDEVLRLGMKFVNQVREPADALHGAVEKLQRMKNAAEAA